MTTKPKVIPMNRAARRRQEKQPTEIPVPQRAQATLRELFALWQQAEKNLKTYMQGVNDTLGLEGEWLVDMKKMVVAKGQKKPADDAKE